jgi:hypothetical protein
MLKESENHEWKVAVVAEVGAGLRSGETPPK